MFLKNKAGLRLVVRGLIYAFSITLIMLITFTLLLRFTSLRESIRPQFNILAMVVGVVLASLFIGIKIKEKGWLNGALLGFIYYFIIILINLIFFKGENGPLFLLSKLSLSTFTGFLGGMIGINIS